MEKKPIMVSQEANQLLLNAIKDKFATQNSRITQSIILPKLSIPTLKSQKTSSLVTTVPTSLSKPRLLVENSSAASLTSTTSTQTASNLNQSLLENLQENSLLAGSGLVLPTLQLNNNLHNASSADFGSQSCVSALKVDNSSCGKQISTNLFTLSRKLDNLCINYENNVSNTIDLTTALSTNSTMRQKPNPSTKDACMEFDIPFIECDRKWHVVELPQTNVLSQTIVSHLKTNICLMPPSTFARIACLQYKCKRKLPQIDHSFKAKHKIRQFLFDTKSPDDVILSKFQSYQR